MDTERGNTVVIIYEAGGGGGGGGDTICKCQFLSNKTVNIFCQNLKKLDYKTGIYVKLEYKIRTNLHIKLYLISEIR